MASTQDVRKIALALDGTTEHPHFDRTAFKVKQIYATLAADGQTLNVRLTPEEQAFKVLMAPKIFGPVPNKWGESGWTVVELAAISPAELEAALAMAWAHALPMPRRRG